LLEILKKIESQIEYLAEARDHCEKVIDTNKMGKITIPQYETKHRKDVRNEKTELKNQK